MKFSIDFDDFSPRNTNFGLLEELREHFPKFKVTLFTVPWEIRFDPGGKGHAITAPEFEPFCNALRVSTDWVEVALHGLTHSPRNSELGTPAEFENISYDEAKKRILVGEKLLVNKKIPYTKLFKAPFWLLSPEGKKAAEDLGFIVAEDHYYNWNLKDDKPGKEKDGWTIAHGHIQLTSNNGLEEVFQKIMNLPSDTDFHFLSEYFHSPKINPGLFDFKDPLENVEIIYKRKGEINA